MHALVRAVLPALLLAAPAAAQYPPPRAVQVDGWRWRLQGDGPPAGAVTLARTDSRWSDFAAGLADARGRFDVPFGLPAPGVPVTVRYSDGAAATVVPGNAPPLTTVAVAADPLDPTRLIASGRVTDEWPGGAWVALYGPPVQDGTSGLAEKDGRWVVRFARMWPGVPGVLTVVVTDAWGARGTATLLVP